MKSNVAIVTGGSQGLGLAIASELLGAGYEVAIFARRREVLDSALVQLAGLGKVIGVVVDVADPDAVRAGFAEVDNKLGTPRVLINNAGVYVPFPIEDAPDALIQQLAHVNLLGPIYCMREAIKRMREARQGDIVNVTSDASVHAFPLLGMYSATKAGLEMMTKGLSLELRGEDIRLCIARVGRMKTGGVTVPAAHRERFYASMKETGAMFHSGKGMLPASVARIISGILAAPRDARPELVEIYSA